MSHPPAAFPLCAAPQPIAPGEACDVLVVGDEPAYPSLLADYLRHAGYSVHQTQNGDAALRFLAERRPRMLMLDVFMPEVDELEVLRRARRMEPPRPVLLMSSKLTFDLAWFARLAAVLGAGRTLIKPFPLIELLTAVQAAIGAPR
jgi:CheY-like chemotaxis protein